MALTIIRHEVAEMLADVRQRLREAEHRLAQGVYRERVDAAGEVSLLRRHEAVLTDRLGEIDAAPPGASESLFRWVSEEIFNLRLCLQTWIAGH